MTTSSFGRRTARVTSLSELRSRMVSDPPCGAAPPTDRNSTERQSLSSTVSSANEMMQETPFAASALLPIDGSSSEVPTTPTSDNPLSRAARARLARQFSVRAKTSNSLDGLQSKFAETATIPVLPISSAMSARLMHQCKLAVELLQRLQRPIYTRYKMPEGPIMPKTALRFSKGLVFLFQHKAGVGLSYTWSGGFVIKRCGNRWSAPCFVKDRHVSLGLTVGYRATDILHAFPMEAAVDHFIQPNFKLTEIQSNLDLGLTLGFDPWEEDAPTKVTTFGDVTHGLSEEQQPRKYIISDGAILDISWRLGVQMVDRRTNRLLYGPEATPDTILCGEVQIPVQLFPLYSALEELSRSAEVIRSTVSRFDMAKIANAATLARQHSRSLRHILRGRTSSNSLDSVTTSTWSFPGQLHSSDDTARDSLGSQQAAYSSHVTSADSTPNDTANLATMRLPEQHGQFVLFSDTGLLNLDLDIPIEEEAGCCIKD
jgi:lipid-binding SYLF domain-containing protein